jgi:hypothetical protein
LRRDVVATQLLRGGILLDMRWWVPVAVLAALAVAILLLRRDHEPAPPAAARASRAATARAPATAGQAPRSWRGQRGLAARRIAGRVTTPAGAPAPRAIVRLGIEDQRLVDEVLVERTADGGGRFDLGALPAARYQISAQDPDTLAAVATVDLRDPGARADDLELRLGACVTRVSGTVRDSSGGVIAGARVRALEPGIAVTTSDESGEYEICVPRGHGFIEASAEGYGGASVHVPASGRTRVDLLLVPEAVIAGTVLDGGAAAAGAAVEARGTSHDHARRPGRTVLTGPDGEFRIAGLPPGVFELRATRDDRAARWEVRLARAGAVEEGVTLELRALSTLRGRVLAGERPVGGALVSFGSGGERRFTAVSQEDGGFVLEHDSRGALVVYVAGHRLLSPHAVNADAAEVTIRVEPLGAIRGRVTRAGRQVPGAMVSARLGPYRLHRAVTDAAGSFALEGLEPGSYDVVADHADLGAMSTRHTVTIDGAAIRELDLDLQLDASIAGTLVDQHGAPVAGALVSFRMTDDMGTDVTAADGSFRAVGLSGGGAYRTSVRASPDGGPVLAADPTHVHVADGRTRVAGVRLVVRLERLAIAGTVVRDGHPVPDVTVDAMQDERSGGATRAITRADGRFELLGLAAGDHHLVVHAPDGAATRIVAAAGARDLRVELPGTGAIRGIVVGAPQADEVAIRGERVRFTARLHGGSFEARDLTAGRYLVQAGDSETVETTVEAGRTAHVVLHRKPTARLLGTVRHLVGGAPVAGAACSGWSDAMAEIPPLTAADDRGAFTLEVRAGEVQVRCNAGRSSGTASVALDPGATRAIEVVAFTPRLDEPTDPGFHLDGGVVAALAEGAEVAVRPGDRLLSIEGIDVRSLGADAIYRLLGDHPPDAPYPVTVLRDGVELRLDLRNRSRR